MAIVPNYKRSARLTPRYQRNIEVSASAEHMGAAIGRGLSGLGQGIGTAGKALHATARLDNAKAQAKEREQQDQQDQMAERERQTRVKNQLSESMEKNRADVEKIAQGPDAYVDDPDLKDFGSSVDDLRRVEGFLKTAPKDEVASIRPGIEAIQVNASNRANQLLQEQTVMKGQQADQRYLDNFVQEAVTDRNDPVAVEKYRLAGLANISASAERDGLDEGEAAVLAHAYSSKLDKDVVLAKLEDEPALALEDYDQLRPRLIETDRRALDRTFSFVRKEEEVKSQISGILSLRRHEASLSVSRQASMPKGENDQPSGISVPLTYLNLASPSADRRLDQELTPAFATNLDALMEDAPQDIRDGLEILPYQDRASIKPVGDHDYWSVQQGQNKVLIRYQGQSLSKAPSKVQDWLADKAASYGLFLPVGSTAADSKSPEDRIADGFDRVLVASLDSPSSRALGPSAKQREEAISAIDNPDLQEAARANLQINLDRQSKQDKAGQLNAARELWAAIDDGKSLDDIPISIRVAAGSATLADATDFIRTREGGKIIRTDAVTLSELNRMMALNPDRFSGQDLDAYRNQISRNDLKELKQHQTALLQQDSQALKRTEIYKATFEQADQLLQQLGRSSTGPDGESDPEAARLNAQFFVNLKARIDYELDRNEGQGLNVIQIHDLIQKQLQTDFPDQTMQLQRLEQEARHRSASTSLDRNGFGIERAKRIPEQEDGRVKIAALPLAAPLVLGGSAKGAAIVSGVLGSAAALGASMESLIFGSDTSANKPIDEAIDIDGFGQLHVSGISGFRKRTLTITSPGEYPVTLTGEITGNPNADLAGSEFSITEGTIGNRAMTSDDLRFYADVLRANKVKTVLNESNVNGAIGTLGSQSEASGTNHATLHSDEHGRHHNNPPPDQRIEGELDQGPEDPKDPDAKLPIIVYDLNYEETNKHTGIKAYGTRTPLLPETAQKVLNESILHEGRRYGYHEGTGFIYQFHDDNHGVWHGFPVPGNKTPNKVLTEMRRQGRFSKAKFNKLKGESKIKVPHNKQ